MAVMFSYSSVLPIIPILSKFDVYFKANVELDLSPDQEKETSQRKEKRHFFVLQFCKVLARKERKMI